MTRAVWVALGSLVCSCVLSSCSPPLPPEQSEAFQQATHRGAAYLENRNETEAIAAFREAAELAPDSPAAYRNLARAYLLASDADALDAALKRAGALEPDSAATAYLSGIAQVRAARFEQAIPLLEKAARLDPSTPAVRFQLAGAYQAVGRLDDARAQLEETIRLDPLHLAAHYRLAGEARRRGDEPEFARLKTEIARLRSVLGEEDRSRGALEVCVHTQPELPRSASRPVTAAAARDVRFESADDPLGELARARRAVVLELDADGRYALVALDSGGRLSVWRPEPDGRYAAVASGFEVPEIILDAEPLGLFVGNFHDEVPAGETYDPEVHARNDLLVLSPGGARLIEQRSDGSLMDATARAGLVGLAGRTASWLDYDHDGDLDLAVGSAQGLALWQNDGDGRFEQVAGQVGLDGGDLALDLAAVDLASDGAIDLVIARGAAATLVYEGRRTGRFERQLEPPGPLPAARRVLIDDLDGDGRADAALIGEQGVVVMPANGGARIAVTDEDVDPSAAALTDYDGDGRLDLVVATRDADRGGASLLLWRNAGRGEWTLESAATGLGAEEMPEVHDIVSADLDGDGDGDLLLATAAGLRVLDNVGGSAGGQLKLRLQGTKSNPPGYGVRVTLRAPGFETTRFVQGVAVELGLDGRTQLDSVQTVWTNGVIDNEIDPTLTSAPLTIVEKNVAAGSCPYLYAWDGEEFRFVTDLLGNSPIGLSERRGVPLPADPDEIVWVGSAAELGQRNGAYLLQVTDELREVIYLDRVRLLAVDHPREVEVHPTDRMMGPPFPPSEVWPFAAPRVPLRAEGDDGIDRTADVAAIDGRFAPPGPLLPPPLRGMTRELVLTLDFGSLADYEQPVLALTGWLQYGDASRNIALSQDPSVAVVPPSLEMEVAPDVWRPVDVVVGMPAGKTKTIVVDLTGKLPPDARRLRLRSSFELRWDRLALLERLPADAIDVQPLEPTAGRLFARGFSEIRTRAPGHPSTPRHAALVDAPPWQTTPAGFVTRFGDVLELVAARDDQLVVMNGGDALELAFEAPLSAPKEGRVRSFFFYSVGWDKDEDHNVMDGATVEPLPVETRADDLQRVRYHTRFVPRDAPTRAQALP